MAREDKLVERITYLTKIALGEEPNKDFSEAILQAAIKAAKVGYSFAVDEAAEWLDENAYKYGFIKRYPENKIDITGINNEPWHYRYVGQKAAKEMKEKDLCLEEYLEAY